MIVKEERIGNQRLILGDCRLIMPLLDSFDAAWTDPPYNVKKNYGVYKDNLTDEEYLAWCNDWISIIENKTEIIAIYCPKKHFRWFLNRLPEHHPIICGWTISGCIRANYIHQYAPILLPKKPKNICPDFWLNVQMVGMGYFFKEEKFDHPGLTSLDMTRRVLRAITNINDTVLDCFLGTGTTLVACQQMGRIGTGIEIDPDYFKIACQRVHDAWKQPDLFIP